MPSCFWEHSMSFHHRLLKLLILLILVQSAPGCVDILPPSIHGDGLAYMLPSSLMFPDGDHNLDSDFCPPESMNDLGDNSSDWHSDGEQHRQNDSNCDCDHCLYCHIFFHLPPSTPLDICESTYQVSPSANEEFLSIVFLLLSRPPIA